MQKDRTADTAESAKTPVGNPVEMFAQENGIPVVRVGKSESLEIDVWAVSAAFVRPYSVMGLTCLVSPGA